MKSHVSNKEVYHHLPHWHHEYLAVIDDVAPMNMLVFAIWAIGDTILVVMRVFMYWLYAEKFGHSMKSSLMSGTLSWIFFFVLFWIGLFNMNLASINLIAITLPLAWLELVIASFISRYLFKNL